MMTHNTVGVASKLLPLSVSETTLHMAYERPVRNREIHSIPEAIGVPDPEVAAMLERADGELYVREFARGCRLKLPQHQIVKQKLPDHLQH